MEFILVLVASYLFGSIPWALIIGKVFYHKDIRNEGSGNLGATNAGRVLGKAAGVTVTLLDAIKALLSMVVCNYVVGPSFVPYAGLACCFGHCFPIFAGFKGGKAVASSFGYLLGICIFCTQHYFWQFFFIVIAFFSILWITRIVSLSSILSLLIASIVSFILKNDLSITLSIFLLWVFVTYRHKANIIRIMNGTESHIKWMGERKHGKN